MVGGPDQSQGQDPEYILAETGREIERLHKQHAWLMVCTKGKMIWAPIDLKKEGLKVLDVGCADGADLPTISSFVLRPLC
jgi:2-polyprenyl-3-methyl-5-hydroxy-6-metoxy-1,4-benzoquinol methylase